MNNQFVVCVISENCSILKSLPELSVIFISFLECDNLNHVGFAEDLKFVSTFSNVYFYRHNAMRLLECCNRYRRVALIIHRCSCSCIDRWATKLEMKLLLSFVCETLFAWEIGHVLHLLVIRRSLIATSFCSK